MPGGPPQPRLAVLFVHGIGSQSYGSTLSAHTDAMIEWLRERFGQHSSHTAEIEAEDARLREPELKPGSPAHTFLRLRSTTDNAPDERWLLAECWWASSFLRPTYRELLGWTMTSAVATVGSEIAEVFERLAAARRQRRALLALQALITLYLSIAILVPILTLVVLLSLAGFVPWIRRLALRVQEALIGSVGDSYVLTKGMTARSAIVTRMRGDLRWLRDQGIDRIVIVAHSQGAEVARIALTGNPDFLVGQFGLLTYGSGTRKLLLLEKLRVGRTSLPVRQIAVAAAVLTATSLAALFFGARYLNERFDHTYDRWLTGRDIWVPLPVVLSLAYLVTPFLLPRLLRGAKFLEQPSYAWERNPEPPSLAARLRFTVTGAGLLVVLMAALVSDAFRDDVAGQVWEHAVPWTVAGLVLAVVIGARVAALIDQINNFHVDPPIDSDSFTWCDLNASADPVGAPGIKTRREGLPESVIIHNHRSILTDHVRYLENWAEFTPRVVAAVSTLSSDYWRRRLTVPPSWTTHESAIRSRLTLTLVALRAEAVGILAILLLASDKRGLEPLDGLARWTLSGLNLLIGLSPRDLPRFDGDNRTALSAVSATLVVLLTIVLYRVSASVWRSGQRHLRHRSLQSLAVLDRAMMQEDDLRATCRLLAQVTVNREKRILAVGDSKLHLIAAADGPGPQRMESYDVSSTEVDLKLGVVRLLLPGKHLHLQPADQRTRRQLHDAIRTAIEDGSSGR